MSGPQLGRFEELVLFALVSLEADAYGAAIRREIEARTGRHVSTGALYTVLGRLEQRGLVQSHVGSPRAERGGRRRKYYDLLPDGAELLRQSHDEFQRMASGLATKLAPAGEDSP